MVGEKLYEAYAAQGKQEEGLNRLIGYMQTFPDLDLINVIYEKALLLKGETEAAQTYPKPPPRTACLALETQQYESGVESRHRYDSFHYRPPAAKALCTAAATATSNPKSSSGTAQPATNGKPLRRIKSRFDQTLSIKKGRLKSFQTAFYYKAKKGSKNRSNKKK